MEFRILGPLEVEHDGDAIPLGGHRQRALLALLLLRANEVVPTGRIVSELWGEDPPRTATTSLQNAVHALRKALGHEVLVTRPPGYVLRAEPDQIDAGRFRRLVDEARAAEPAERVSLLRDALGLWRGAPLADLELDEFVQGDVRHLEELRLSALEDRIDAELELGGHRAVVGELERLVREHPLRERLRRQLMLALYRVGRQADALAAYQDARRLLLGELGIDPGPALQQLHGAILRQERSLDAADRAAEDAPDHFAEVSRALLGGRLVVVLGADSAGLAGRLSERFEAPPEEASDLARLAQFAALAHGTGPLYDELHELAERAAPTAVHEFVARLPPVLRERGAQHPLVVTTAYDVALEQALLREGEEFDLVTYLATGRARGRFCHLSPDGSARVVEVPNTYASELSLDRRTVVLRLAGGLDSGPEREWESFVVTEDDFIEYLPETPIAHAIPVGLAAKLRRSHLLFVGCSVREWSLRSVMARVWGSGPVRYRSWAVVPAAAEMERRAWLARGVELVERPLEDYVETLARYAGLPAGTAA